jgi:excisionase family DNA binding protein
MLTMQQAADMLDVSRPYLAVLIQKGELRCVALSACRRVPMSDVVAYKARRDAARRRALIKLARLGQEFDAS